jgi:thioredoxin reductase (NADPH)
VGCIPKKLYHQAALLGEAAQHDLPAFGWKATGGGLVHDWPTLREAIQNHICSLNFGCVCACVSIFLFLFVFVCFGLVG